MRFGKFITSSVLGAAVLLGATGCSLESNVASLTPYAPSDGVQVNLDDIKLRNFIFLVSPEHGALIGSVVNSGKYDQTVLIQYRDAETDETKTISVAVEAGAKVDFGFNEQPALEISPEKENGDSAVAGGLVQVYASLTGGEAQTLEVPVLDGTLPEYADVINDLAADH